MSPPGPVESEAKHPGSPRSGPRNGELCAARNNEREIQRVFAGVQLSDVSDWRLHDIRRTVSTGVAREGVAPHVIERILDHQNGEISGVAAIYNRFGYLSEMRDALERWERHVMDLSHDHNAAS